MTTEAVSPTQPGSLDNTGFLVTGGGSGIGKGTAQRLCADGAAVLICGRTEDKLVAAADSIRSAVADARIEHRVCDVTDEAMVAETVAAAAAMTGKLDGLFACAGGSTGLGPITTLDYDTWQTTVGINLHGTFLSIKHAGGLMASQGSGSIVGMSSIAGSTSHRWFGAYGPSKAGIDMLVKMSADELGASGVRVNAVQPGVVATEIMEAVTAGGEVIDDYLAKMPVARVGEVDDIASLVRFLLGPESSWITGQSIGIDGGMNLRAGPDYSPFLKHMFSDEALRGVPTES